MSGIIDQVGRKSGNIKNYSGMPLKVTQGGTTTKVSSSGALSPWTNFTHNHTRISSNSDILLTCSFVTYINGTGMGMVNILEGTDGTNYPTSIVDFTTLGYTDNENGWVSFQKLYTPATASPILYWRVDVGRYAGTATIHWGAIQPILIRQIFLL